MSAQHDYAEDLRDKKIDYEAVEKSSQFKRFLDNKKIGRASCRERV